MNTAQKACMLFTCCTCLITRLNSLKMTIFDLLREFPNVYPTKDVEES